MKLLQISDNLCVSLDDEDFERISKFNWHLWGTSKTTIVRTSFNKIVPMANEIMKKGRTFMYDHRDRNFLNNQKENLRECTHSQNMANRSGWSESGYKGVTRHGRKWRSRIRVDKVLLNLGTFNTPEEAAKAYNDSALLHFKEFALLNEVK